MSGEPIAADRSRHGDHHRDIVNIAWDYGRTHPIAPPPSRVTSVFLTNDAQQVLLEVERLCDVPVSAGRAG